MNLTYIDNNMEYETPGELPVQTDEQCPNHCGYALMKITEANGPDDYRNVYYCEECEERFDE